jgi:hypothetical protein
LAGRAAGPAAITNSRCTTAASTANCYAALRHRPPALHCPDIVGRLSLLFGQLGQAVAQARSTPSGETGAAHPAVVLAIFPGRR